MTAASQNLNVTKFEWKLEKSNDSNTFLTGENQDKKLIFGPVLTLESDKNAKFVLFAIHNRQGSSQYPSLGMNLMNKRNGAKKLNIKGYLKFSNRAQFGFGNNGGEYQSKDFVFKNLNDKWEPTLTQNDKQILSHFYYNNQNYDLTFCCEVEDLNPIKFKSEENSDSSFRKGLWGNCKNCVETDLKIFTEGKTCVIAAHKIVLISQSEVLKAMLTNPQYKEAQENCLEIGDFDLLTVKAFVEWMYLGAMENLSPFAENLFAMADFYQVKQLKDECAEELAESLTNENLVQRLSLAVLHSHELLKQYIVDFIAQKSRLEIVNLLMSEKWITFVQKYGHLVNDVKEMFEQRME